MINKGCEVTHIFSNGFVLGEEQLQTLVSKIKERYPEEELIYRITKSDSYIYQSSDLDDVINEENGKSIFIKKLELIINNKETICLNICFEKNEDTVLKISGFDKDKIYLLYSEIKPYINEEITTVKGLYKMNGIRRIGMLFAMIPLLVSIVALSHILGNSADNIKKAEVALNAAEIRTKMDYFIQERIASSMLMDKYMGMMIICLTISAFLLYFPLLLRYLLRKESAIRITDFFLFGKQKEIYEKKVKIRNNIIWTIIIGLIVSILAGLIVYLITT